MPTAMQTHTDNSTLRAAAVAVVLTATILIGPSRLVAQVGADIPESISVQLLVTDPADQPINNPSVTVTFILYRGLDKVWSETQVGLAINDGILNAVLGTITDLDTLAFNSDLKLGVSIDGDPEMTPRVDLTPAPYALAMRGMHAVRRTPPGLIGFNIIGGYEKNSVARGETGVTISGGGGFQNGGDRPNTSSASWTTIGGGTENSTTAPWTTISGGRVNIAEGSDAVVGGGVGNTATGQNSTISGGSGNTTGTGGTVGGGTQNSTGPNIFGTVAGGFGNTASGLRASIGGGWDNIASSSNTTVAGGRKNVASSNDAAVLGGNGNLASGSGAAVLGGVNNQATSFTSAAAGARAAALHSGTFVWADASTPADTFASTSSNQFLIQAAGGVGINTNSPSFSLEVGSDGSNGNGAHVTNGGTWTNGSSREFKHAFKSVDGAALLAKLAELEISTWSYKDSDEGRHMGPIAEDFAEAFGLGNNHQYISTVDADGVSMAAIKELFAMVNAQSARIEELERRLDADR